MCVTVQGKNNGNGSSTLLPPFKRASCKQIGFLDPVLDLGGQRGRPGTTNCRAYYSIVLIARLAVQVHAIALALTWQLACN